MAVISDRDGFKLPEGWLCATTMECRAAQQGPVIDLHGINEDVVLRTMPEEFKGARACHGLRSGSLGVIETEEPEVFAITVQFGGTEESRLEEVEEIGGGLDVEVLLGVEADLHMNKV